ncbi:MAG: hypothetical protein HKN51_09290 [Saprospiraceae bacterium]|nr:hypothetical protein [Saprospiraceae bacterium]
MIDVELTVVKFEPNVMIFGLKVQILHFYQILGSEDLSGPRLPNHPIVNKFLLLLSLESPYRMPISGPLWLEDLSG